MYDGKSAFLGPIFASLQLCATDVGFRRRTLPSQLRLAATSIPLKPMKMGENTGPVCHEFAFFDTAFHQSLILRRLVTHSVRVSIWGDLIFF